MRQKLIVTILLVVAGMMTVTAQNLKPGKNVINYNSMGDQVSALVYVPKDS